MIEIKVTEHLKDLDAKFKALPQITQKNVGEAIKYAGLLVVNTAVDKISRGPRSGRLYKRGSEMHKASDAGEYPKTDRGGLVGSIRLNYSAWTSVVGSNLEYADALENGTKFMAPRPWLRRSRDANEGAIHRLILKALRTSLDKDF